MGTTAHETRRTARTWTACAVVLLLAAAGCQTRRDGPTVLQIEPNRYRAAFDTAVDVSDAHRFAAALRDRRRGVIETEPVISPSIFEPWKSSGYTLGQMLANTSNLQRRWVRWEFTAVRFNPETDQPEPGGADVLSLGDQPVDLTRTATPIELRVAVFVERSHDPGHRPQAWTTSDTTRAVIIDPETGEPVERSYWVPAARDERYERRLLAAVARALSSATEGAESPPEDGAPQSADESPAE